MLGLRRGTVHLTDYDPEWPRHFQEEKARLQSTLPSSIRGIEHYGSTAVPGLRAKPVIDILLGVDHLDDWTQLRISLESLHYDYREKAGIPDHVVFAKGPPPDPEVRTAFLHILEFEGPSWRANLAFRDALRANLDLQKEYLAVKEAALAQANLTRRAYNQAKEPFIQFQKQRLTTNS